MKKAYFNFLKWIFPNEKNIVKNKFDILSLLFNSENLQLSTKESIDLFKEVQTEFHQTLAKRSIDAQIVVADVEEYFDKLNHVK